MHQDCSPNIGKLIDELLHECSQEQASERQSLSGLDEYQFIYNSDGNLAKQQAVKNGIVEECYNIEYDSLGRVIRSREENGTSTTQRTEYLYDTANRLKNRNRVVGERKFSETYTYSPTDGTVTSLVVSYTDGNNYTANDRLGFTYDDLNRPTKVLDTENGNHLIYSRNYEYQNLTGNRTTSRVSQYSYSIMIPE